MKTHEVTLDTDELAGIVAKCGPDAVFKVIKHDKAKGDVTLELLAGTTPTGVIVDLSSAGWELNITLELGV